MIKENDMFSLLNRKVPEIRRDINCIGETGCPYKMAAFFAAFTKNLIAEDRLARVRDCLELAEQMLREGDYMIRNAIENVFVFSVSRGIDPKLIKSFSLLGKEFEKQIYAKSI